MRKAWFKFNSVLLLLMLPVLAQGQEKITRTKETGKSSPTGAAIKALLSEWWLWTGIIVILGLIGLLFYLRNKTDD